MGTPEERLAAMERHAAQVAEKLRRATAAEGERAARELARRAEVDRLRAATGPPAAAEPPNAFVGARLLGKPDVFHGGGNERGDWKVIFKGYVCVVSAGMGRGMAIAEAPRTSATISSTWALACARRSSSSTTSCCC